MDEGTIRDEIGIKNSAHRSKIVSSLVLLKAKNNNSKFSFLFFFSSTQC